MNNDIEYKQAKNLLKSLTKDENSIFFFFAVEKITNSLLKKQESQYIQKTRFY